MSSAFLEVEHLRTVAGERDNFARYFETYFPEAFEQLGSIVFGHFRERGNADVFTWIRGFKSMDERVAVKFRILQRTGLERARRYAARSRLRWLSR